MRTRRAREQRAHRRRASRSVRTSVTSAASRAMSAPAPIAKLTSAAASAGASFTPSPTMPTTRPCPLAATRRRRPCPRAARRRATRRCRLPRQRRAQRPAWSPVTMTTSTPIARSRCTAPRDVGRTAIGQARSSRRSVRSRRHRSTWHRHAHRRSVAATPDSARNAGDPTTASPWPSTRPRAPLPGTDSKRSTSARQGPARRPARESPAPADASHRARPPQRPRASLRAAIARRGHHRRDLEPAFGERAGLVETSVGDRRRPLQRGGVAHQHAELRARGPCRR